MASSQVHFINHTAKNFTDRDEQTNIKNKILVVINWNYLEQNLYLNTSQVHTDGRHKNLILKAIISWVLHLNEWLKIEHMALSVGLFLCKFNFFFIEWWDLGRDLAPVRCEVDSWFFHFSAKIRKTGLCVLCLFSPSIYFGFNHSWRNQSAK